jgi:hypothetical protein
VAPGNPLAGSVWPEGSWSESGPCMPEGSCQAQRGFLQSDHAFDNFIGPITNPILSKDPRSNTYIRFLFIQNTIPGENLLHGNDFQA